MAIHKNSQKSRKHKTVGLRKVIAIIAVVSAILISESFIFETSEEVCAYPAGCVTQACREASDRATASANRARELAASAQTLENEVNRLNAEIAMLEDEISMNQYRKRPPSPNYLKRSQAQSPTIRPRKAPRRYAL